MPVQTITKAEFEQVIGDLINHPENIIAKDEHGEWIYTIPLDKQVGVHIRSTILRNGLSAPANEDSIRVYLVHLDNGDPLGAKVQRWIARTSGWAGNLTRNFYVLANWRKVAGNCSVCRQPKEIRKVKKKGPNEGKLFATCWDHDNQFVFLPEEIPSIAELAHSFRETDTVDFGEHLGQARETEEEIGESVKWEPDHITYEEEGSLASIMEPGQARTQKDNPFVPRIEQPAAAQSVRSVILQQTLFAPNGERKEPDVFDGLGKPLPALPGPAEKVEQAKAAENADDQIPEAFFAPTQKRIFVNRFKDGFQPSEFQQDIFVEIEQSDGNLVIIAVAGSGKTTTELRGLEYTDPRAKVAFCAFNRSIAATAKERAPKHVKTGTLHSLSMGIVLRALPETKLMVRDRAGDVPDKMDLVWDEVSEGLNRQFRAMVQRIVALCKSMLLEPTEESFDFIVDRYNFEILDAQKHIVYSLAEKCYRRSIETLPQMVDFNDIIWVLATGMVPIRYPYDVLLVDESQDLDPAQIELVSKLGKRIIAVGDPNQSIYGFRGADVDAMPKLIAKLNAKTMPLSICYRCPESSIRLAQTIVPQILPRPNAPLGILQDIPEIKDPQYGDLILSRKNAPLVKKCFELIRQQHKASIQGRDIGAGISTFLDQGVKTAGTDNLNIVLGYLEQYTQAEVNKLMAVNKVGRAEFLLDQFNTLVALSDGAKTIGDVKNNINIIFASNDHDPIKLSSVHRAKGLEAPRVFIIKPEDLPMSHPKQAAWEWQQEQNVTYVAYTRNKEALYFVREP